MKKRDYIIHDFDRLRDMSPEGRMFNFKCSFCKSKDIDLIPVGISWKNQTNNSDLPKYLEKGLNRLPDKATAILLAAQQHNIVCYCKKCKKYEQVLGNIDRLKLTKWVNKNVRNGDMNV